MRELQIIQDTFAPPKRVQVSNKLAPWFDSTLQKYNSYKNDIHKIAVINDDEESWRMFRNVRNIYNKMVKKSKNGYFYRKLRKLL